MVIAAALQSDAIAQQNLFSRLPLVVPDARGETEEGQVETLQSACVQTTILEQHETASDQTEIQEQLVARTLQGDHAAFHEIVSQYGTLMFRTASIIVGDADTAEDIVQEAFIQAWHHLADLRKAGALRPWLMRIVVNQCISHKRRLARSASFLRQAISDHETDILAQVADDHKGHMERNWDLAQAITLLPTKQRMAIVLHYYYGMTLPEMAGALTTSENTLKKRIQAALTNLRRILQVTGDTEAALSLPSVS